MDLVRSILIQLQDEKPLDELGNEEEVVLGHIDLLIDAGLLEGQVIRGERGQPAGATIQKITWQGHDFLDSIRDENRWHKVREKIVSAGGAWTVDILKALSKAILLHDLGIPLSSTG